MTLLPCPFCGAATLVVAHWFDRADNAPRWAVRCTCRAEGPAGLSPEEAAARWNRRASCAAHIPAVMAATEPVQIDRPVVMAEVVEERSCFTCRHDRVHHVGIHACRAMGTARGIYAYTVESGCHGTPDGMPTNRTLKCPGWAPKEPT